MIIALAEQYNEENIALMGEVDYYFMSLIWTQIRKKTQMSGVSCKLAIQI